MGMGIGVLSPHTRSWNHGMLWVGRHHKDNLIPPQASSNVFHSFVLGWFGDFCFVLGLEQRISEKKQTPQSPRSHHSPSQCKLLGCLAVDHLILKAIQWFRLKNL